MPDTSSPSAALTPEQSQTISVGARQGGIQGAAGVHQRQTETVSGSPLTEKERRRARRHARRKEARELYSEARSVRHTNPREAIQLLLKATTLSPRDEDLWELLGESYLRIADRQSAAHAFKKVAALRTGSPAPQGSREEDRGRRIEALTGLSGAHQRQRDMCWDD